MAEIFQPGVRFEHLLKDVRDKGYAFDPQALTRGFLRELRAEILAQAFEPFRKNENGVRQEFDVFTPDTWPPLCQELGTVAGQIVRHHRGGIAALANWEPNHLAIQRYNTATAGIGRHRDYASDILLVASFTVCGSGKILLYPDSSSRSIVLETGPGSLMLLRGPGIIEGGGRVAHEVCPPLSTPRISATFRLDTRKC